MQHFSDLKVWRRSHALVLQIYAATKSYPGDERFGLVSQLRGSLSETEYLLLLSRDLGYLAADVYEPFQREASEIARMLHALRTKVAQNDRS